MSIQVSNDPAAFRAFEHSGWNEASEGYETAVGPLTAQSAGETLDAAGVIPGCKVLDVCTGHGVLALAATKREAKVFAIDFAEAMVAAARRNVPAAECRQSDAQDLPYADNTFDAVVCGYGIIHVPEPNRAFGGNASCASTRRPCSDKCVGATFAKQWLRAGDGRNKGTRPAGCAPPART